MKEFKFIVKVTPNHPEKALEKLGEVIEKDKTAFQAADLDFVRKCDFITAVPIEIALTTDLRARNLYLYPDLRFIITGVPASRVQNLIEFGYLVLIDCLDLDEPEKEAKDEDKAEDEPKEEAEDEQDKANDPGEEEPKEKEPKESDETPKYFVNGHPATEEEFKAAHEEFRRKIEEFGFSSNFQKWLNL